MAAEIEPPNPQELRRVKDELVGLWDQLPKEHQASMALVLIDRVMQGEMGTWLKEAISIKWAGEREDILAAWRRLPRAEQAAMMVEQLRDVLGSEQGKSLRGELGLPDEPAPPG